MASSPEISASRARRAQRRKYHTFNDRCDEEEASRVTKCARKDRAISRPLRVEETGSSTLIPLTKNANRNAGIFSSSQPISGTEDRILQSENPSSNAPISQQGQASVGSFNHEEAISVLGRPGSESCGNFDSTSLGPGNSFGGRVDENDGQANIADAAISEDLKGKTISVAARSREKGNMVEPSSQDHRSWVWAGFSTTAMPGKMWTPKGSLKPRQNREIRCNWPGCSFSTTDEKRQGSTSNMLRHLNARHLITKKDHLYVPIIEVSEHNLIKWIINTAQPFTAIEDPAFQQIFIDLPGVFLPFTSACSVSRRIMEKFDTYRYQLKEDLSTTCKTVAISLDVWTSETETPILAIIGHWLTPGFDYREKVFDIKEVEGSPTGDNLAEAVYNCLSELGVELKLNTITAENSNSNVTMMPVLHQRLLEKASLALTTNLLFDGERSFVRCLAHIIDLVFKEIFKNLKADTISNAEAICDSISNGIISDGVRSGSFSVIQKVRVLAIWISRHSGRKQTWKRICQITSSSERYIPCDVASRWTSTHYMLQAALEAQSQVMEFIRLTPEISFLRLTHADYITIRDIVRVLSLFEAFTRVVTSSRPQISFSLSVYWELFDLLQAVSGREANFRNCHDEIAEAAKAGMLKFQKYYFFMDESNTYYTATILDPRFKLKWLKKMLGEGDYELIVGAIRSRLHARYGHLSANINMELVTESMEKRRADSSVDMNCSIQSQMTQAMEQSLSQTSDIDRYFDSEVMEDIHGAGTDENWLLNWWCRHTADYPCMAAAARDFLAIPASKAAVEKLLSEARDVLGTRKQGMSVERLRSLMLAKDM